MSVGGLSIADDCTVDRLRCVGALPRCHGRRRAHWRVPLVHLIPLGDALGHRGHVGTLAAAEELAASKICYRPTGVPVVNLGRAVVDSGPTRQWQWVRLGWVRKCFALEMIFIF